MPLGDKTGPLGLGPGTGRRLGYCAGYPYPGYLNPIGRGWGRGWGRGFGWRRGWGRGWGLGWGRRWGYPPAWMFPYFDYPVEELTPKEEKELLKEEKEILKDELEVLREEMKAIEERLKGLEKKKK